MPNVITSILNAVKFYLQDKTVTPSGSQQVITPDSGYDALGSVTVEAVSATSITPSDSSPVSLAANELYSPTTSGYAIANSPTIITYQQLQSGVYFSSGIKKMDSSGYAYLTSRKRSASGIYTTTSSGQYTVDLGWNPSYLAIWVSESGQIFIYNSDKSTTQFRRAGTGAYSQNATMPYTSTGALREITANGFTVNGVSGETRSFYYFAIE